MTSAEFGGGVAAHRVFKGARVTLRALAMGAGTAIVVSFCTSKSLGQTPLGANTAFQSWNARRLPAISQANPRPFAARRLPPVTPPDLVARLTSHEQPAGRADNDRRIEQGQTNAHTAQQRADEADDGPHENDGDDDEGSEDEDGENEDGDQVTRYIEELFLGMVVYPQEKDEVQLTWGFFDGVAQPNTSLWLFEVEYGITDRFQIGLELPFEVTPEESLFDGMRNFGAEVYYNFYNNARTGAAYGAGFELGFPVDADQGESRTWVYEPFFVAYRDFGKWAMNFSGTLEVEDPIEPGEQTEAAGELALALLRPIGKFVLILEVDMEVAREGTPVRLAPGLYWHPFEKFLDLAISCPIGLNRDAPDIGLFLMAIVEFDAHPNRPGIGKNTPSRRWLTIR